MSPIMSMALVLTNGGSQFPLSLESIPKGGVQSDHGGFEWLQ